MANVINYAEKYGRELEQKYTQGLITGDLVTPNVNWLDAKTFKIPNISITGMKNHSRNGGFNRGDVTLKHNVYTLEHDRDIEIFIDKADVDETNQALSSANVSKIVLSEHAIPENDAYNFSTMATEGNTANFTVTKENIFGDIKTNLRGIRKYGAPNIIIYASSETMDALEQSPDFTRKIDVQTGANVIDTRVTRIDGVKVVEVYDVDRFYNKFDYTTGFIPTTDAQEINYIIVAKQAVVTKPKINTIFLFAPGEHSQGDGYLYQTRLYWDFFVKEENQDGVFASLKPAGVVAQSAKTTTKK